MFNKHIRDFFEKWQIGYEVKFEEVYFTKFGATFSFSDIFCAANQT